MDRHLTKSAAACCCWLSLDIEWYLNLFSLHWFCNLFLHVPHINRRAPSDSTNGAWKHTVFTFWHNRVETLTFYLFEHLISVPASDCIRRWGIVLNLVYSLSSLSSLPLLCLSSLIVHLFVGYRHSSCLFPVSHFSVWWWWWAAADCCRWSGSLQTAGGRGGSVWGAQMMAGWLAGSSSPLFSFTI